MVNLNYLLKDIFLQLKAEGHRVYTHKTPSQIKSIVWCEKGKVNTLTIDYVTKYFSVRYDFSARYNIINGDYINYLDVYRLKPILRRTNYSSIQEYINSRRGLEFYEIENI